MIGRIQVKADNVLHLRNEIRVSADLVSPDEMRLQLVSSKDIGDAAAGEPISFASKRVDQRLRPAGGGDVAS